uniref:DUF4806 domain-containing protein n=1 Tax=Anopheles dirus TaxID=7168 RepID=A0A182N3V2_9DIPT
MSKRMPYVLVETTDPTEAFKDLFAAPETWVEEHAGPLSYLRWPNARNIRRLNSLLADEGSVPTAGWERYQCKIISRNINSLVAADKIIQTIQKHSTANASISDPLAHQKSPENGTCAIDEPLMHNVKFHQLFSLAGTEPTVDPLEDVKPCPQILDLISDLRNLIEKNQQEIREKLSILIDRNVAAVPKPWPPAEETIPRPLSTVAVEPVSVVQCTSLEQLDGFEALLNDEEHFRKVVDWVKHKTCFLSDVTDRMNFLMELVFEKKLVRSLCWGDGARAGKRSMLGFRNILKLFGKAKMDDFEAQLYDDEFRNRIHKWTDFCLPDDWSSTKRMREMIDLILDRKFFARFSWRGIGKDKLPLYCYTNVLLLFQHIGSTTIQRVNQAEVVDFFKSRLQHAAYRNLEVPADKLPSLKRKSDHFLKHAYTDSRAD